MTSQPTPGPWVAQPGTTTGQEVVSPSASAVRRVIARCGGPARDGNAQLIAAAPDMLTELRDILAFALDEGGPLRQPEIASIRAVIAKAEGRS